MSTTTTRRGGTISELLAGLAALALLAVLLIPGAARMRAESRTASSLSQLRWIAGTTSAYAADSADRFWGFSWKAGVAYPFGGPGGPLLQAPTDLAAGANQAIDILHRKADRRDMQIPTFWLAHALYSHLPLADYAGSSLPNFNLIAPGDKYRLAWARDPRDGFDQGKFLPYQPEPLEHNKRWPYSSSYQPPVTWWNPDDSARQGASQRQYSVPSGAAVGGPRMANVAYPSQKVMVHDTEQREGSGPLYCVRPEARTAMLMADGSAGVRATADANVGWEPGFPTSAAHTRFFYDPSPWEAPSTSTDYMIGHYRWTRGGIAGRDFGGPEIDTGQP